MIERNMSFTDLKGLLALKPQTKIQDFVKGANKYGVSALDAQALAARKDIFPRQDTLNIG